MVIFILDRGGGFKKIEAQLRNEALATRSVPPAEFYPGAPPVQLHTFPIIRADEVVARMTPEEIRPAVISWVKSLEAAPANAPRRFHYGK